jgi:hypothetical protein|tara:strand:- start:1571 stop:1885 length:315 start_codon:yes stop_codon:yes gene_type:complete
MSDKYEEKIRAETFLQIRDKIDEISDLVKDNGLENDFMACYCFAIMRPMSEDIDGHSQVEHMSGFSAETPLEIQTMTQTMLLDYFNTVSSETDTSSIDHWLNKD